jgi:hypothetical protein
MEALADRGVLRREGGRLFGGVNLGSIGLSRRILDALLEEFEAEVNDPDADRGARPDLDPQFFTALTVATLGDPDRRARAWSQALAESAALRDLETRLPGILPRLRRTLERFEARHGRPVRIMALDFEDQWWGDIGQHRQMYAFYSALRDPGAEGRIARALAGLEGELDGQGNLLVGDVRLGPGVEVKGSVLVDARVDAGTIENSVLLGTRACRVEAADAFDVSSTAASLQLPPRAGTYRAIAEAPLALGPGERLTTVVLPDETLELRVHEDTDLRDKPRTYDVPWGDNPVSFREAHRRALAADPVAARARRRALEAAAAAALGLG